jgi:hypothetical protein
MEKSCVRDDCRRIMQAQGPVWSAGRRRFSTNDISWKTGCFHVQTSSWVQLSFQQLRSRRKTLSVLADYSFQLDISWTRTLKLWLCRWLCPLFMQQLISFEDFEERLLLPTKFDRRQVWIPKSLNQLGSQQRDLGHSMPLTNASQGPFNVLGPMLALNCLLNMLPGAWAHANK